MGEVGKDAAVIGGATVVGGVVGGGVSATLGGMGLAVVGTAVALPLVAIGAGLGLIIGGAFVLGKRMAQGKKQ